MFKAVCDKCGTDCDKVATFVNVKRVTNYATCKTDINEPIGKKEAEMQLCLCQSCYGKLGFPNIYDTGKTY